MPRNLVKNLKMRKRDRSRSKLAPIAITLDKLTGKQKQKQWSGEMMQAALEVENLCCVELSYMVYQIAQLLAICYTRGYKGSRKQCRKA